MTLRIYSLAKPLGVERNGDEVAEMLGTGIADAVAYAGVWRGACPCCEKPIVVRDGVSVLSTQDREFLLKGMQRP